MSGGPRRDEGRHRRLTGASRRLLTQLRPAAGALALYAALVLLFTLVSLHAAPPASQTGVFRPLAKIPVHVFELAAGGLALGLVAYAISRRLDVVLLIPAVVVLTDLDHLPSALGLAQPIRPAHSILFVVAAFVLVATIIKRLDLSFAAMSGFFIHLSIDTGQFPAFSPLSFRYSELGSYVGLFLTAAVASALLAGYLARRTEAVLR